MKRFGRVALVLCAFLGLSLIPRASNRTTAAGFVATDLHSHAGGRAPTLPPAGYGYTAAEFMTDDEIVSSFPVMAARGVGLILPVASTELLTPSRLAVIERANAQGVEVRPWLLLPEAEGYWPNATNAVQYDRHARALIDAWLKAGLEPTTFIVDMEMSVDRALHFAELAAQFDTPGLIEYLRRGIDRPQYAAATKIYHDLVAYAHTRGFRVQVTTLAQVIDDYTDGDDGLRQAFNIPIDGIAWDEVNIQIYRTLNSFVLEKVAGPTSPYFVYDYAAHTRAVFGERGSVSIGCTDPGDLSPTAPSYKHGEHLREDVDAAVAAGIPRALIAVYGLRGIVRRPPMERWFPAASEHTYPPFPDLPTFITRSTSALLDAFL